VDTGQSPSRRAAAQLTFYLTADPARPLWAGGITYAGTPQRYQPRGRSRDVRLAGYFGQKRHLPEYLANWSIYGASSRNYALIA